MLWYIVTQRTFGRVYRGDRFGLRFNEIKNDFKEFKDSRGTVISNGMRQLKNSINTLPVSTAECERGFSKMNIICSSLRSKLTVSHISSLMFVSLCGPPLSLWEPITYVKSWLVLKRRSANCTQGPARKQYDSASVAVKSLWNAMK